MERFGERGGSLWRDYVALAVKTAKRVISCPAFYTSDMDIGSTWQYSNMESLACT